MRSLVSGKEVVRGVAREGAERKETKQMQDGEARRWELYQLSLFFFSFF